MNMLVNILIAAVIIGVTGCLIGFLLCLASEKFKVEVDPREEKILGVLPGNNCGGCGYPGCSGLAAAIAKGEAPVNQCPVGGAPVAAQVGEIMGVDAGDQVRMMAYVRCSGNCEKAKNNYSYTGVEDCNAMAFVPGGGPKACKYGCLGFGSCVKACPFDAIHVVDGIAVVDKEACKACGKCVATCPKHLIELIPYEATEVVSCRNEDKGKDVMAVCSTGCIACHLCEKQCESDAIHVENNIAYIDQSKCTHCGKCAEKCPKKIIKVLG
ncbi:MAG: RnfABCDGE type electron transport complex subunit B [Lachnospiraceae bacterium]|nr:RnfABCDGE type electron transport complex subunit B [Lachnospiraceae bacterium]